MKKEDLKVIPATATTKVSVKTPARAKAKTPAKATFKAAAKELAALPVVKAAQEPVKEKTDKKKVSTVKEKKRVKYNYELRIDLLGEAIKKARKERKLTQKELGQLVGVKKAQISKLENSLTDARFETIIKVFKALNVKINFNVELLDQTVTLK
jgi:DNA-binding XRE family transcriptional regulator